MESTQRGYMLTKQTSFLNSYYNNVKVELVSAVQRVLQGKRYITPTVAEKMASSLDDKQQKELHHQLSDREFSVFKMLSSGKSITEIADALYLSATTVSTYRSRILSKMNFKNNAELTVYAMEHQLFEVG